MSDDNTADEAPPAKSGKGKLLLVVGMVVLVLAGGGAAAFLMMSPPAADAAMTAPVSVEEVDSGDVVFVDLPDLLVNLNVTGRRLRFLKVVAALEVKGEEQAELVRQFLPRIQDSFHMYLRAVRPEELEGSEGVYRIKEELLARTNEAIRPARVKDVLVRQLLVQ